MINKIVSSLRSTTFMAGILPAVVVLTTTALSIATYSA